MATHSPWTRLDRAARAIRGKDGQQRHDAISTFLRAAMVALLVG